VQEGGDVITDYGGQTPARVPKAANQRRRGPKDGGVLFPTTARVRYLDNQAIKTPYVTVKIFYDQRKSMAMAHGTETRALRIHAQVQNWP
jgi:hypothetical protein